MSVKRENLPNSPKRAKLFKNGNSQAVRLPMEYRFEGATEVEIKKVGNFLLLSRIDEPEWSAFEMSMDLFDELDISDRDQPEGFDQREKL